MAAARLFEFIDDGGIGVHFHHLALNPVDDARRRTCGCHQAGPRGNIFQAGQVRRDGKGFYLGQCRKRTTGQLRQGTEFSAVYQRQTGGGPIDDEVDAPRQQSLHHIGASLVGNENDIDARHAIEQIPCQACRDGACTIVQFSGIGPGLRNQFLHGLRTVGCSDRKQ